MNGVQEAASSNLATPTRRKVLIFERESGLFLLLTINEQVMRIVQIHAGGPHPSSLRSATFPKWEGFKTLEKHPCHPLCGHSVLPPTV